MSGPVTRFANRNLQSIKAINLELNINFFFDLAETLKLWSFEVVKVDIVVNPILLYRTRGNIDVKKTLTNSDLNRFDEIKVDELLGVPRRLLNVFQFN